MTANTSPGHSIWCQTLWILICIGTLGFPDKYFERLEYFKDLAPEESLDDPWTEEKKFSDRGHETGVLTMRQKQQEEWDRLNIAVSVITATSAAALAIQAVGSNSNQVYWLATAFYSAAFGMSLQGIILITYLTIVAGGSSDELIGRLARGKLFDHQPVRPIAFMMALPAILAVYSAFALLAGLVAMIVRGPCRTTAASNDANIAIAMIPIGATFVCLCFALITCELGAWIEREGRRRVRMATTRQGPSPRSSQY